MSSPKKIEFISIVFMISLLVTGIFHEYLSCALSVLLLGWLIYKVQKDKKLLFIKNTASIAILSICLFYGISFLWAIDAGMAIIGFFKYLPVGLFLICLMQQKESAEKIKLLLPYVAAGMTVVSLTGMYLPATSSFFTVAGRLAGFFEYPNTFALLLLVSELLLLEKDNRKVYDYVALVLLVIGILFTGSRTLFVLAILSNILMAVLGRGKKTKIICLCGIVVAGAVLLLNQELMTRFLRISTSESTFVGRLLYFQDALPVIIRKPLGTGFLGHYFMQQSIQTGVYSVRYIHNDLLQILLDIGWLPFFLLMTAIIKVMLNKKNTHGKKVILGVIVLHSCFDFNLQFISMFCLFILFLDWDKGKEVIIRNHIVVWKTIFAAAMIGCIYVGSGLVCMRTGNNEMAYKLNPWNTENNIVLLTQMEDIDEATQLAEKIVQQNEYVSLAYSVMARQAYSKGDFGQVIQYKNQILEMAPFQYEEYEDYCYMLMNGYSLYTQAGDSYSAEICKEELLNTRERLENVNSRLSNLGRKIKDQPITELPEDIEMYINGLE